MPAPEHHEMGKLLSLEDLEQRLGYSKRSLYRMAQEGVLPVLKIGKRWGMRPEALDAWLAAREVQPRGSLPGVPQDQEGALLAQTHAVLNDSQERLETLLKRASDTLQDALQTTQTTLAEALAQAREAFAGPRASVNALRAILARLVAPAVENGITAVYAPRSSLSPTSAQRALEALLQAATGEIRLQGITLRRFLHDTELQGLLRTKLREQTVTVQALLLDPCSEAARTRVAIEEGIQGRIDAARYADTQTFMDIQLAVTKLRSFQQEGLAIDARFYSFMPFAFFFLTETDMIIEQYHLGREETINGICIGERVPLLHVSSTIESPDGGRPITPFYQQMYNSFTTIWAMADLQEQAPLSVKLLRQVYEEITCIRTQSQWPATARP